MESGGQPAAEAPGGEHGAYTELGPALPSRLAVYAMAAEVHALARIALELVTPGREIDVARAVRQIERIRAVVGAPGNG